MTRNELPPEILAGIVPPKTPPPPPPPTPPKAAVGVDADHRRRCMSVPPNWVVASQHAATAKHRHERSAAYQGRRGAASQSDSHSRSSRRLAPLECEVGRPQRLLPLSETICRTLSPYDGEHQLALTHLSMEKNPAVKHPAHKGSISTGSLSSKIVGRPQRLLPLSETICRTLSPYDGEHQRAPTHLPVVKHPTHKGSISTGSLSSKIVDLTSSFTHRNGTNSSSSRNGSGSRSGRTAASTSTHMKTVSTKEAAALATSRRTSSRTRSPTRTLRGDRGKPPPLEKGDDSPRATRRTSTAVPPVRAPRTTRTVVLAPPTWPPAKSLRSYRSSSPVTAAAEPGIDSDANGSSKRKTPSKATTSTSTPTSIGTNTPTGTGNSTPTGTSTSKRKRQTSAHRESSVAKIRKIGSRNSPSRQKRNASIKESGLSHPHGAHTSHLSSTSSSSSSTAAIAAANDNRHAQAKHATVAGSVSPPIINRHELERRLPVTLAAESTLASARVVIDLEQDHPMPTPVAPSRARMLEQRMQAVQIARDIQRASAAQNRDAIFKESQRKVLFNVIQKAASQGSSPQNTLDMLKAHYAHIFAPARAPSHKPALSLAEHLSQYALQTHVQTQAAAMLDLHKQQSDEANHMDMADVERSRASVPTTPAPPTHDVERTESSRVMAPSTLLWLQYLKTKYTPCLAAGQWSAAPRPGFENLHQTANNKTY